MQMAIATPVQILVMHVLISVSSVKVPAFSLPGSTTPTGLGAASAYEDICCFLSLFLHVYEVECYPGVTVVASSTAFWGK